MQQQARADSSQADLDASTMGYNARGRPPPCDTGYNAVMGDERGAAPPWVFCCLRPGLRGQGRWKGLLWGEGLVLNNALQAG